MAMAAVSAWAKPGAWALDAEEHEAAMEQQKDKGDSSSQHDHHPADEFPSLAAAAATKASKKKKKSQPLSLAEFSNGGQPVARGAGGRSSSSKGLTPDELLLLPSAPRERTTEELERSARGFGYSSYGGGRPRRDGEDPYPRSGPSRVSDEHPRGGAGGGFNSDSGPSRADEIDDWAAMKKSVAPPPMPERRERGGGFFDSQSRADDSDSWILNKTGALPSNGRRITGGSFDGPRERRGGFETFNREGSNGGGVDSDMWGKSREETSGGGGRPRLVLQPRSLPLANGNNSNGETNRAEQVLPVVRSKGSNPFGEARPREEILKEKGQDWKTIDEKLESMTIREAPPQGQSFGKKGLGMVAGLGGAPPQDRTERTWRKADVVEAPPSRVEEDEGLPGN